MTTEESEPDDAVEAGPDAAIAVGASTEDGAVVPAEVAFVVPAPVSEAIATDDPMVIGSVSPPMPLAEAVAGLGEMLGRRLDALASAFDREIRAEATREKVVDRLHAELQDYKNDLLLNMMRPVFVDLIQLHDDIGKIVAAQAGADTPADPAKLLDLMRGFQQGIEDILYRQGVEPFATDDDAFDPRRQRATATVATEDPDLNKRVAARLRKGFRAGERTIRPEVVSVYALKR